EFRYVLKYIICHRKRCKSSIDKKPLVLRRRLHYRHLMPSHAGADNTGSLLLGKGKVSCWKAFLEADDSVLNADWPNSVERRNLVLISKLELKDLKKQAESDRLPPTQAALPSPSNCGWAMENAEWVPVMTTLPPAPEAVIALVKCGCSKE
ncbi:unnamed protein product, partial [Porites evermanni]